MNKSLYLTIFLLGNLIAFSQPVSIIESDSPKHIYELFNQEGIKVYYYQDEYAIITGDYKGEASHFPVDESGFEEGMAYFVHHTTSLTASETHESIKTFAEVLYLGETKIIFKIPTSDIHKIKPYRNDALTYIGNLEASLPDSREKSTYQVTYDERVAALVSKIVKTNLGGTIIFLENYGTRNWFEPESYEAQMWVKSQFANYNLEVETMSLNQYGNVSPNVVGTLKGSTEPDKYVIVGAHCDSYSYGGLAPGADDNASGVSGVLEIARILSTETFDYSIIFASWSGEEYGLYGSYEYAARAKGDRMDIIGYVNMDMTGYTSFPDNLHTDLIAPTSAKELAGYYREIVKTYITDFKVDGGQLIGGNSDHSSFNRFGFQGIFPFEDVNDYSPYIHTSEDIYGTSVNTIELSEKFTQSALATVASLATRNSSLTDVDNVNSSKIRIFPNPVQNRLFIDHKMQDCDVSIYNIIGKEIQHIKNYSGSYIDTNTLSPGVYIIQITSVNSSFSHKFIKN